jgi:hypothetical protein
MGKYPRDSSGLVLGFQGSWYAATEITKEAIFASLFLRWNEQRWQVFLNARDDGAV